MSKKSSVDHQLELEKEVVSDCKTNYMGVCVWWGGAGGAGGGGDCRKRRPEMFCKNVFLKDFAKFTGKHLCQSILGMPFL